MWEKQESWKKLLMWLLLFIKYKNDRRPDLGYKKVHRQTRTLEKGGLEGFQRLLKRPINCMLAPFERLATKILLPKTPNTGLQPNIIKLNSKAPVDSRIPTPTAYLPEPSHPPTQGVSKTLSPSGYSKWRVAIFWVELSATSSTRSSSKALPTGNLSASLLPLFVFLWSFLD